MLVLLSHMESLGATLTPFSTQCGSIRVDYGLPVGTGYLAGKPLNQVEFPAHRDFPLVGGIAAVGWGLLKDVPQVQIDLVIMKIAKPRFDGSVAVSEWELILREEKMTLPPYEEKVCVIRDLSRREWLEAVVEEKNLISARSYIRPIGPDLLLLIRLNLGKHVTEKQRTEALQIQDSILQTIKVNPTSQPKHCEDQRACNPTGSGR